MKFLVVLVFTVSQVFCLKYNGLRVSFGWSPGRQFHAIPRTENKAVEQGWVRVIAPDNGHYKLIMYCPYERTVCVMYLDGFIAGLQIAIPLAEYDQCVQYNTTLMATIPQENTNQSSVDSEQKYWIHTQFFISEETYKKSQSQSPGSPFVWQRTSNDTLQEGAVWVLDPNRKLRKLPLEESGLQAIGYEKQNCMFDMGTHYYYKMTPKQNCKEMEPWFALTSEGSLIGTGIQVFGKFKAVNDYNIMFDIRQSGFMTRVVMPNGPECLYDWTNMHGLISMHIYYVAKPWKTQCEDGDSVSPPGFFQSFVYDVAICTCMAIQDLFNW